MLDLVVDDRLHHSAELLVRLRQLEQPGVLLQPLVQLDEDRLQYVLEYDDGRTIEVLLTSGGPYDPDRPFVTFGAFHSG